MEVNACAAAKTSMESKENNIYVCIDTKLSTVVGIGKSRGRIVIKNGRMMRSCTCLLHQVPTF
jgi:hypothetical protein